MFENYMVCVPPNYLQYFAQSLEVLIYMPKVLSVCVGEEDSEL